MFRSILTSTVLAAGVAACGASSPTRPDPFDLGAEFTLAPGQSAKARDEDVEVGFVEVTGDSRCPTDVTCVWAGEVKVRLSARGGPDGRVEHEVREGDSVVAAGYRIAVVGVKPLASSTRKIVPEEYRATFRVTRAASPPPP